MGSGHNTKFVRDPIAYLKSTCVSMQTKGGLIGKDFDFRKAHEHAFIDFSPWSWGSFAKQVVFTAKATGTWTGKDSILKSYYFPYIQYGSLTGGHAAVPLKGIPKTNPAYNFIFTGGVNGCSPMLLEGDSSGEVWGFHYPNSDGQKKDYPLLNLIGKSSSDIIISLDFKGTYGSKKHPNGFAFFYYQGTKWVGVTQSHLMGAANAKKGMCTMSINKDIGDDGVTIVG
ncbi:MAG: hypothetical protein N2C14_32180 [Planctomycetales bacterium]